MNVESGVVVPRLQPFDFVGVKDFLIFQRGQTHKRLNSAGQGKLRTNQVNY